MTDINPVNSNPHFFTRKFVSDLKSIEHQSIILINYGLTLDSLIESSDFSKVRNTGKKFYTRFHLEKFISEILF